MNNLVEFTSTEKKLYTDTHVRLMIDPLVIIAIEESQLDDSDVNIALPAESNPTLIYTDRVTFSVKDQYEDVLEKIQNHFNS